jgi:phosphoserine aminotransferase
MSGPEIRIPADLLPADGRFGSGPSKVRPEAVQALNDAATTYLGTSHRQSTVRAVVGRVRSGLRELYGLPDGWEVVLGNGGSTQFWDVACFSLVRQQSQHLVFGEFSSKFAAAVAATPFLGAPQVLESDVGTHPVPEARDDVDTYALTHNETSTGVTAPVTRPAGAEGIVLVDATSAAGALRVDLTECDVYYFAPQKALASDGGLWLALCTPAAVERARETVASARWIPASLDLMTAVDNSRLDQTYNTPSLATIFLIAQQLEWMNAQGGLEWAASRCDRSAATLYDWAESAPYATPFVKDPDQRSHTVATIDFDPSVDAMAVAAVLRSNGVVDTEPYRKLGRNQLRIAMFPAVDPEDIAALTRCIDHVVERLA